MQAGLFSATVTAFIIESYKNLKPDPGEMAVAILLHISRSHRLLRKSSEHLIMFCERISSYFSVSVSVWLLSSRFW